MVVYEKKGGSCRLNMYQCLPMEPMEMMETFAFALLKIKSKSLIPQ